MSKLYFSQSIHPLQMGSPVRTKGTRRKKLKELDKAKLVDIQYTVESKSDLMWSNVSKQITA